MPLLDKNFAGHDDTLLFKFLTAPVKNMTLILVFTWLGIQIFLQLAWFCVNGTSKSTNSQQVENLTGIK